MGVHLPRVGVTECGPPLYPLTTTLTYPHLLPASTDPPFYNQPATDPGSDIWRLPRRRHENAKDSVTKGKAWWSLVGPDGQEEGGFFGGGGVYPIDATLDRALVGSHCEGESQGELTVKGWVKVYGLDWK